MNFTEIQVDTPELSNQDIEIISGLLMNAGFSGIHFEDEVLHAYYPGKNLPVLPEELADPLGFQLNYSIHSVKEENWNERWERSFRPLVIDEKVGIRASFQDPTGCNLDIVIDPGMAFGTGHHATTLLMIKALLSIDPQELKVLDMGTGTGILAILAEKMGAYAIHAVDNNDTAIMAARENLRINACSRIRLIRDEYPPAGISFDLILANINRNTLISRMRAYNAGLHSGGSVILSGFYVEDEERIKNKAIEYGLIFESFEREDEWSVGFFRSDNRG